MTFMLENAELWYIIPCLGKITSKKEEVASQTQ